MYLKYIISVSGTLILGNLWFQCNHKEKETYLKGFEVFT